MRMQCPLTPDRQHHPWILKMYNMRSKCRPPTRTLQNVHDYTRISSCDIPSQILRFLVPPLSFVDGEAGRQHIQHLGVCLVSSFLLSLLEVPVVGWGTGLVGSGIHPFLGSRLVLSYCFTGFNLRIYFDTTHPACWSCIYRFSFWAALVCPSPMRDINSLISLLAEKLTESYCSCTLAARELQKTRGRCWLFTVANCIVV